MFHHLRFLHARFLWMPECKIPRKHCVSRMHPVVAQLDKLNIVQASWRWHRDVMIDAEGPSAPRESCQRGGIVVASRGALCAIATLHPLTLA